MWSWPSPIEASIPKMSWAAATSFLNAELPRHFRPQTGYPGQQDHSSYQLPLMSRIRPIFLRYRSSREVYSLNGGILIVIDTGIDRRGAGPTSGRGGTR